MARLFNGTTNVIRADSARVFNKSTECSIAFWAKFPSPSTNKTCYSESATANANNCISLGSDAVTGAKLRLFIKINISSPSTIDTVGTITAFDGNWHHIAFTQNVSNNVKTYVDGILDLNTSYSSAATYSAVDLAIGALIRNTNSSFFQGSLAHVANWQRVLSPTEIIMLASGMLPLHLKPHHYWPLWGIDSPEPDIGETHVVGTLNGTTLSSEGLVELLSL